MDDYTTNPSILRSIEQKNFTSCIKTGNTSYSEEYIQEDYLVKSSEESINLKDIEIEDKTNDIFYYEKEINSSSNIETIEEKK